MPRGLSLSQFDAVLFDVDGTLVDSIEMCVLGLGDAYERYLATRPRDEEIRRLVGMPLSVQLRQFGKADATDEELKEMTDYVLERYEVHQHHERLLPAAIQALKLCYDHGVKTALVTSKNDVELSGFLKRFPGAQYVHKTVCASDVVHPKPDPECVRVACERLGAAPERTVMIGDSLHDLRSARAAGIAFVAVAYGAATKEALQQEQPDELFETSEELLEWAKSAFLEPTCPGRS